MKIKKRLAVVSYDRNVNTFLIRSITPIIGSEVEILGVVLDGCRARNIPCDVVMTSNEFLRPQAEELFPGTPVICPRRMITGYNLEKLLMLPGQKEVLVVNHPQSATEETIASLVNLGISHLIYVPYWKGRRIDFDTVDTAVSPGMAHLCPEKIRTVIDIGPRIIGIHSFLRLLSALELDAGYLEIYANHYHHLLMESSRKLSLVLDQSEMLRRHMEVILDEFDDGLISVDEKGRVSHANAAARRMLDLNADGKTRFPFESMMKRFEKISDLSEPVPPEMKTSAIYAFGGKEWVVHRIPVSPEKMGSHIYTFKEIAGIQRLEKDVRIRLGRKGYVTKYVFSDIWSRSDKIRTVIRKAWNFAATEKNILITGESGTGKELFAHAIHQSSPRKNGPFVAVNFAGIPESLIESELFGYEEGAFTGARKGGKMGLFEQAHGGSIFLDEIGDASPAVQARLLRVLQEKEVMKVGGSKIVPVDVRIIAATNADLNNAMAQGRFRKDLFFRLSILPLHIPPLRERKEDILHIFSRYLEKTYSIKTVLTREATGCLTGYLWPGNIRELLNAAEYVAYSTGGSPRVELEHLPDHLKASYGEIPSGEGEKGEDALLETLCADGLDQAVVIPVLSALKDRIHQVTGRNSLTAEIGRRGCILSEAVMKRYLRKLGSRGLIRSGRTKQGTSITPKGEEFLAAWGKLGLLG